jgi:hypothetical protein
LFIIQFISKQGSSKPALHADSRRFYAGFLKKSVKVPLENLRVKREEYESYKNLVVAATGERVIIVVPDHNKLALKNRNKITLKLFVVK